MHACIYVLMSFVDRDLPLMIPASTQSLLVMQEFQKPGKWGNSECIGVERGTIHGKDLERLCHGLSDVLCVGRTDT
jgi:hypothetical protein